MANDSNAVRVAVTGSVHYAPIGTALPTSTGGSLNAAFNDVGYISEDGITTSMPTDTNAIKAWQNGDTVRTVQTSHDYSIAFTMIETNERSLAVYFGAFTHGAAAASGVVQVTGAQPGRACFVLHVIDGLQLMRIVLPNAQVTERGDVTYANGDAVTYPLTITAYPDASGVKAYVYFDTDAAS